MGRMMPFLDRSLVRLDIAKLTVKVIFKCNPDCSNEPLSLDFPQFLWKLGKGIRRLKISV